MSLPQPLDRNIEDALSSFDSVPLFMKSLPDDSLDNPVINALQSLIHDGTPDGNVPSHSVLIFRF